MTANTKMTEVWEERLEDALPCTCIDAYKLRGLSAPDCGYCQFSGDVMDIIKESYQAGRAEMAEECISIVQKDCDAGFCKNKEHEFGCSQCCIEGIRAIAQHDGGKK